jgi:hypothetical protein
MLIVAAKLGLSAYPAIDKLLACPVPSSMITVNALPETQPGRLITSLIAAEMSGLALNTL